MDQSRTRFPILFTGANSAMSGIGISPSRSWVDVDDSEVHVQLSWAFHTRFPRAAIRSVALDDDRVGSWGAHGWRGRWLVNGSSSGLVRIELSQTVRAWVSGFPVRLHTLRVSVTDRDALVEALGTPA